MSGGRPAFRALVLQHEQATPGGLILGWLAGRGAHTDVLRVDLEPGEVDVSGYDLLVPLGAESAAYHDHIPWIPREAAALRRAHESGTAVLGICFGAQLLARALGAACRRADSAEIGWLPVRSADPEFVAPGPWFQWHFDTFKAPPAAELIAESDVGPQAYVLGRSMGVQFHPEVTPQIVAHWVRAGRPELDAAGVGADGLLQQTRARAAESRAASLRLLDTFGERVAKLPADGRLRRRSRRLDGGAIVTS